MHAFTRANLSTAAAATELGRCAVNGVFIGGGWASTTDGRCAFRSQLKSEGDDRPMGIPLADCRQLFAAVKTKKKEPDLTLRAEFEGRSAKVKVVDIHGNTVATKRCEAIEADCPDFDAVFSGFEPVADVVLNIRLLEKILKGAKDCGAENVRIRTQEPSEPDWKGRRVNQAVRIDPAEGEVGEGCTPFEALIMPVAP